MEDYSYTNWEQEREALISDILDILRAQEDDKLDVSYSGSFEIIPKTFEKGTHTVEGPFSFDSSFLDTPVVTFGQHPAIKDSDVRVTESSSNYSPFLVFPYVYDWEWETGTINGFSVGLYVVSYSEELGSTPHTIYWNASGSASRYKEEGLTEEWTEPYYNDEPDYLIEGPTHPEDSGY